MTNFESVLKTAKTLAEWNNIKDSIRYFRGNSSVVFPDTLLVEKVEVEKLKTTLQELLKSPFIRTDLEIEIEVRNARRNWKYYKKKGKRGFSDEDFHRILTTKRIRLSEIEQILGCVETEKP